MRRINAWLSALILILFIVHAILGAYSMLGLNAPTMHVLSWTLLGLVCLHMVIGIVLTVQTLQAQRRAGVSYPGINRLFWARRISGFAIMVLIGLHVTAFAGVTATHFRLPDFDLFRLCVQILLVISIGVHVITNAKPMLIALGVERLKPRAGDIAFWISLLLLLAAFSFIVYFLRFAAM